MTALTIGTLDFHLVGLAEIITSTYPNLRLDDKLCTYDNVIGKAIIPMV